MDPQLLQNLLYTTVLTAVGVIAYAFRQLINIGMLYLRARMGETQFAWLSAFAQSAVRSIEQNPIYQDFDGASKKELAIVAVLQYCEKHNLPVDRELLDKTIEAAVQIMNSEVAQIDWNSQALTVGE